MSDVLELIEAFYAGALHEPDFLAAMGRTAERLDATGWSYRRKSNDGRRLIEFVGHGFQQRWIDRYEEVVTEPDPVERWSPEPRPGTIVDLQRDMPAAGSPVYESWTRPQGIAGTIAMFLEVEPDTNTAFSIVRHVGEPAFDERDVRTIGTISRHVVRATELRKRIKGLEERLTISRAMLDRFAEAALVTDGCGRVVETNAAAHALLAERQGLRERAGQLVTDDAVDSSRLLGALARAAAGQDAVDLALPRRGRYPLSVRIAPLLLPAPLVVTRRGLALVLVVDPEAVRPATADQLRKLFGLTVAEARVALAVSEHDRLQDVADMLGRGLGTIRAQLSHALAKTGTRRQAELVKLMMALGRQT